MHAEDSPELERSGSATRIGTDDSLKQEWSKITLITKETLKILDRISDRAWVVNECLRFEAQSIDESRLILQCGLRHAVAYAVQDQLTSEDQSAQLHLSEDELGLCALRYRALHALDTLELHVAAAALAPNTDTPLQPHTFMTLRDRSLTDEAITAVAAGRSDVAALFLAGGGSGATAEREGLWKTLEALPYTAPASRYEPLLQSVLQPMEVLPRPLDWAEDARLQIRIAPHLPPHIAAYFAFRISSVPLSVAAVEQHLGARLRAVERATGWAEGAAAVSALAATLWPQSSELTALNRTLQQLCMLAYETSGASHLSLAELEREQDEAARLALLLNAMPDEAPATLRARVLQFAPQHTAQHLATALTRCIAPQSGTQARVIALLTHETATPASFRVLSDTPLLVRTSLAALHASPDAPTATALAAIERLALMLKALVREEQQLQEQQMQQQEQQAELHEADDAVSTLLGQVAALKLLQPYGVAWRLAEIAAASHEAEKGTWLLEWLVRQGVARRAPRITSETEKERLWRELLADLRFLQHAPLGPAFASPESISTAALTGLLAAQCFALAADLVRRPELSAARSRALILAAARAHVDGAASLADHASLAAAHSCLELAVSLPESSTDADLARERSFLAALRRLAADESWRRTLVLWPPSRLRAADATHIGSLLLAPPTAYRRVLVLLDVLSLLGAPRARLLPLLQSAATAALETGEHDLCASLLTQLHDAQHAPAVALTRKWLSLLMPAPPTASQQRPYASAKPALGFLAMHDTLLPTVDQSSVSFLFLASHVAAIAAPPRPFGVAASLPLARTSPPVSTERSLHLHRFYSRAPATWAPSESASRHSALVNSRSACDAQRPDAPSLLNEFLHRPPAEAFADIAAALEHVPSQPANDALPLLRVLLVAATVHHAGLAHLRSPAADQFSVLQSKDALLAARLASQVADARAQHAPDPRLLLASPSAPVALMRLDAQHRSELLLNAARHTLATRPADLTALLALAKDVSVEPTSLLQSVVSASSPSKTPLSPAAQRALRNARLASAWPALTPPLDEAESLQEALKKTAAQVQTEQQADVWLMLLNDDELRNPEPSFWTSVLPTLFAVAPETVVRRALHYFVLTSTVQDEATLLSTLRGELGDRSSALMPLLIEVALGARSKETQEWALASLLALEAPLKFHWSGLGLLHADLLASLRAANAPLYEQLMKDAASSAPLTPPPRLCHPVEMLICSQLRNGWLTDASELQLLQTLSPRPALLEPQLLRIWRRISLLSCSGCKEARQGALAVLGRILGL